MLKKWIPTKEWTGVKEGYMRLGWDPEFQDWFLDIWYRDYPKLYNQAHKICNKSGSEMMTWLANLHTEIHHKIWETTNKESLV